MIKEKISQLIDDSACSLGYIVYESSIYLKGENSKIIVVIDSLSGISHLDCEKYSKELTGRLNDEEIQLNYSIDISSPGLKRLVRNIEEFERFTGAPVKVIYEIDDSRKVLKGEIINVSEDTIEFKTEKEKIKVTIKNIVNANLDY